MEMEIKTWSKNLHVNSENREDKQILLYIDAVCVLSIQTKKSRQPFRKD